MDAKLFMEVKEIKEQLVAMVTVQTQDKLHFTETKVIKWSQMQAK